MDIKLYMVSLGPSDFELVTIKALKALQKSCAICIPTKSSDNSFKKSITYKIVQDLMNEFNFSKPIIPVYSPMQFKKEDWQREVDILIKSVEKYKIVSFVTLGDASIYSSVYYLLDIIEEQNRDLYKRTEVIAGVTSFSFASSKIKKPICIGDSRFEVIPLLGKEVKSTKIYMRPKVGMNTKEINEEGIFYTFENLSLSEESIQKGKIERVKKYMTLLIDFIKRGKDGI